MTRRYSLKPIHPSLTTTVVSAIMHAGKAAGLPQWQMYTSRVIFTDSMTLLQKHADSLARKMDTYTTIKKNGHIYYNQPKSWQSRADVPLNKILSKDRSQHRNTEHQLKLWRKDLCSKEAGRKLSKRSGETQKLVNAPSSEGHLRRLQ